MAQAPKGIANRIVFDNLRRAVESDLRASATPIPRERDCMAMSLLFAAWLGRYSRRREAIEGSYGGPRLGDRELADRLAARWRARDAAARGLPTWWDTELREYLGMSYGHMPPTGMLDAPTGEAPHGYGPSFRAPCLEAEARGAVSFGDVTDHGLAWARRRAGTAPSSASLKKLAPRLERRLRWHETGDAGAPWRAEVDGASWPIRLGDFPEEAPYLLEVDGKPIGAILDWPEAWLRGAAADAPIPEPPPAAPLVLPNAPEAWPRRYADGAHEEVWAEMLSLGPRIREKPFAAPAEAVARETMRRVPTISSCCSQDWWRWATNSAAPRRRRLPRA